MAIDHASETLVFDPVRRGRCLVVLVILLCGSIYSNIGLQIRKNKYEIPYTHLVTIVSEISSEPC